VARTVGLNRQGLGSFEYESPASHLAAARVRELLRDGATLIDGRDPEDFERAHIPRSLNVPSARAGFATRCARLADPNLDTMVLGRNDAEALRMVVLLEGVGFTCVRGIVQDGLAGWSRGGRGFHTASTRAAEPSEVRALLAAGSATVLDVRDLDEWERGHVAGSLHIPWNQLPNRLEEVRAAEPHPIIVACASGFRAALAASFLRAHDVRAVRRLSGGDVTSLVPFGTALRTTTQPGSGLSAISSWRTDGAAADRKRTAAR
jgi:rhodanese-related sulfurtransferase